MITIDPTQPIFVIDDNPVDRMIIGRVLDRSHLRNDVEMFDDGRALTARLTNVATGEATMPALVLADINMPGLTGFDVLEDIRSSPAFTHVPVVFMLTSSEALEDRERAVVLGANGYLAKPSGMEAFVDEINSAFGHAD